MARYNRIQIGDIHLTEDGTALGKPCRVEVEGLVPLRPRYRRTLVRPIEGPAKRQLFDNLIGEQITMTIFQLRAETYEDLLELIDEADESTGEINTKIFGDLGDFDLDCVLESNPTQPGQFRNGIIPSVSLVWSIVAVNEIEDD
ncbi:MAG: hypothetical protein KF855_03770 [Acidobacteria bacterium]|nr:hypothetical protein [Acidobacteriota bacterium]